MIEHCRDFRRIKRFPEWNLCISSEIYYLMETKDGADLGVWVIHPCNDNEDVLIHACLGNECRGRRAAESAKNAFAWVFENTKFRKIYALIPKTKRHAQFMASWSGMEYVASSVRHRCYLMESANG